MSLCPHPAGFAAAGQDVSFTARPYDDRGNALPELQANDLQWSLGPQTDCQPGPFASPSSGPCLGSACGPSAYFKVGRNGNAVSPCTDRRTCVSVSAIVPGCAATISADSVLSLPGQAYGQCQPADGGRQYACP